MCQNNTFTSLMHVPRKKNTPKLSFKPIYEQVLQLYSKVNFDNYLHVSKKYFSYCKKYYNKTIYFAYGERERVLNPACASKQN